ncbi:putative rhoptry protein, partial [Toxoplasma gondii ARI]
LRHSLFWGFASSSKALAYSGLTSGRARKAL